jgi:hypothetical protein
MNVRRRNAGVLAKEFRRQLNASSSSPSAPANAEATAAEQAR